MQQGRTLPCSYQITENAGSAKVHGGELEIQGNIGAHVQLGAGVGYTKAVLAADAPSLGGVKGQLDRTDPATFQRAYALLDLRTGIIHGAWEANLFVSNAFDKQAALSRFNSDNYDASTRSRIFTNRPRTAGLSLQWKF